MFKKAAQRGRNEREAEAYSLRYVEDLSDARTKLEAVFNILSVSKGHGDKAAAGTEKLF